MSYKFKLYNIVIFQENTNNYCNFINTFTNKKKIDRNPYYYKIYNLNAEESIINFANSQNGIIIIFNNLLDNILELIHNIIDKTCKKPVLIILESSKYIDINIISNLKSKFINKNPLIQFLYINEKNIITAYNFNEIIKNNLDIFEINIKEHLELVNQSLKYIENDDNNINIDEFNQNTSLLHNQNKENKENNKMNKNKDEWSCNIS